jgi:hypothetical protein
MRLYVDSASMWTVPLCGLRLYKPLRLLKFVPLYVYLPHYLIIRHSDIV